MWASIDPGLSGTGVAIWTEGDLEPETVNLSPRKSDWRDTLLSIVLDMRWLIDAHKIKSIYYEKPMFMASAAAANARQDIVKLTLLAGAIHGMAISGPLILGVTPIEINDWKGQVSKEMMNERVRRHMMRKRQVTLGPKLTTHELDAIGIGLYVQGEL